MITCAPYSHDMTKDEAMRQIPLLFSPAMIEAILAGRKTETRRITKLQGGSYFKEIPMPNPDYVGWVTDVGHGGGSLTVHIGPQVGDLIWVKEAHYAHGHWELIPDKKTKGGKPKRKFVQTSGTSIVFDAPDIHCTDSRLNFTCWYKRPSMFMFKADSRLTLRVTGFNIERLHDISEAAAIAEGIEWLHRGYHDDDDVYQNYKTPGNGFGGARAARESYRTLWNTINGPGAWDRDPWVECTKFEVIKRNVGKVAV